VFGNRVLRRIFRPEREEVARSRTRLHNEELHNLYTSSNIIRVIKSRRMRWAGHVARAEEKRNEYIILVGKPEGKRLIRRLRHRWEDNITMNLREIGWESVDWIHVTQNMDQLEGGGALVNMVTNFGFRKSGVIS
jgi:hypothetical protein